TSERDDVRNPAAELAVCGPVRCRADEHDKDARICGERADGGRAGAKTRGGGAMSVYSHSGRSAIPTVATPGLPPIRPLADEIITEGKPKTNCIYYIDKLRLLLDTPVTPPGKTESMFRAGTATAVSASTARLSTAAGKGQKEIEEKAAAKAVFTKKPG